MLHNCIEIRHGVKDTVYYASSLDVAFLAEVQLDKLSEATGVVVVHSFGISEGLHDRTRKKILKKKKILQNFFSLLFGCELSDWSLTCSPKAPPPRGTFGLWTTAPGSAGSWRTGSVELV